MVIPSILPRVELRQRALASVWAQTLQPDAVAVAIDNDHVGVWATRRRAINMATTEWVAMLDDDDELFPQHLERLADWADAVGADFVYSGFESVPAGWDELGFFGKAFDPEDPPATVGITVLLRRRLAASIPLGPPNPGEVNANDDHRLLHGALARGAHISHLPVVTWRYHMEHNAHTSGQPSRW